MAHPAVGEAGVIGIPRRDQREEIKAFVILRQGHEASEELRKELVAQVRNTLGPIATPKEVEFVPTLPKTRSGKIMRRVLKGAGVGHRPGGPDDAGGVSVRGAAERDLKTCSR